MPQSRRAISLAHLTVIDTAPPQMVRMAARIGFDAVGFRLIAVTDTTPGYPLMDAPAQLRDTKAALAATGLKVLDIEFVRMTPAFDPAAFDRFLAAGAELGARHVICAPYDPELGRLADNLAHFADRCADFGLRPVLEFFPWTNVPDLSSALAVVAPAGQGGPGVLVDTLHFDRSGSSLAALKAAPAALFPFVHVCDAPVHPPYSQDDLLHAGRAERLPPGEGQIDIPGILSCLPPDLPLALEVPMSGRRLAEGSEAVARAAYVALLRLIA
jgi:sugar phosphate isomerase/epimerase